MQSAFYSTVQALYVLKLSGSWAVANFGCERKISVGSLFFRFTQVYNVLHTLVVSEEKSEYPEVTSAENFRLPIEPILYPKLRETFVALKN